MEATVLILDEKKERDHFRNEWHDSFPEEYNSFTDFQRTSIGPVLNKATKMHTFSFTQKR